MQIPSSEWLSIVHGDNPGHESPVSGSEEERVRLAHDSKRYCASVCPPARCPICLEYFPLPGASGECCSYHGGFVCHECLGGLLKSSPHQARLVIHPGSRVRYQLGLHCTEASGNCLGTLELRDAMALDPAVVRDFLASIRKCAGCGDTASVSQAAVDGRCRGNHTLCDTCLEAQVVRDVAAHDVAFDGGLVCGCRRSDGKPCSERLAMAAYRDRLSEDARTALMTELLQRREALVNGYEQNEVWSVEAVRTFAIEHIINHRCPACRKTFQVGRSVGQPVTHSLSPPSTLPPPVGPLCLTRALAYCHRTTRTARASRAATAPAASAPAACASAATAPATTDSTTTSTGTADDA